MIKGIVISGEFGKILVREKSDAAFELGELLIAESNDSKMLLQVYDLIYGSQLSQQNLELVAGMSLEDGSALEFMDKSLRNYNLALIKTLITLKQGKASISKSLPSFFSVVREVEASDVSFLSKPKNPLVLGKLRSGSKILDVDIALQADLALSHHILISGTTGRGKSVLLSNLLWNMLDTEFCGVLVLDPHDEYYGKNTFGLKDHKNREKLCYYSPRNPPPGGRTLVVNLACLRPYHLQGVVQWSDPQEQALVAYFRHYGDNWIESLLMDQKIPNFDFMEGTINVVKRRLQNLLNLSVIDGKLFCDGVFAKVGGASTVLDITKELENSRVVIIDTSLLAGDVEILIGSLVASEVFGRYKSAKTKGTLKDLPVVSIVLEEAPRVLGKEVLEKGPNIFSTIAREGRKFKVGLAAITQLPSQIPRDILANINTKIILGLEMKMERTAIIESASQDLSDDDRNIASLDVGEAIVTSNFLKLATPFKVPSFDEKVAVRNTLEKRDFSVLR